MSKLSFIIPGIYPYSTATGINARLGRAQRAEEIIPTDFRTGIASGISRNLALRASVILLYCLIVVFGVVSAVSAASVFDITFPVSELENCADKNACKAYCDELSHADACAAFAKKYGIGDARATEQAAALPNIGPGGCTSTSACKKYCDQTDHFDECIEFAESNGLLNKKEIQQARKAITKGPGGCTGIEECKQYCSEEANHLACVEYAHREGQISDSDYKAIKDIKEQGGPGGCKGNKECHEYCQNEDHIDECLSFSESHGFISQDDAVTIRKAGFGGAGPGGCKGNDACRAYCEVPEHQNECIDFGEKKGFMSKEEASRARKFAGKTGPGGCRGDQCRNFCENPANADVCLEHAEREGLIPKEEVERARKFLKTTQEGGGPGGCKNPQECRTYCQDKTHEQECFEFGRKQGFIRPEEEKKFKAGMDIRKKVEQNGGPGGCKGDDECRIYCTEPSHTEECIAFAAAHGGIDADQARMMLQEFTTGKFSEGHGDSFEDFQRHHEDTAMRFNEFKQLEEQFRGGEDGPGFSGGPRFGPPPGRFPGQQPGQGGGFGVNFGAGQQNFVGPGGCTGPAECIKYCSEHREECFSGGPQHDDSRRDAGSREENHEDDGRDDDGRDDNQPRDFPQFGRPQFGRPQFGRPQFGQRFGGESEDHSMPQLRGNIVHEFKSEDLPQGFEGRTMEERQQFFREKFEQFKGEEGAFPGRPSQGFPGDRNMRKPRPGEQGGDLRRPEFQGQPFNGRQGNEDEFFKGEGEHNFQDGTLPRDSQFPRPSGQNFPETSGGMTDKRFPFPSDGQRMPQDGGFHPPEGGKFPPPSGGFQRPPEGGQFQPPPGGTFQQHPSDGGAFQPPLNGSFQPPPGGTFQQPSGTSFQQPPPPPPSDGSFSSPPPSGSTGGSQPPPPPPPTSRAPQYDFFASLLNLLLGNY